MGTADGSIIGVTQILDNGDPAERFNLVLVSEGYRQSELDTFESDADHFVSGFFNIRPFDDFSCAFNIYRLDVASNESGADDPTQCGGTGAKPKTYFDATFCSSPGVRRALTVDSTLVQSVVNAHVPQYHSAQVIVNSSIYGGTGGAIGVSSTATHKDDGTPVDWREILVHEMGHSIFGLGDEYGYYKGCDVNEPERNQWTGGEPSKVNITASPVAAGKWADLINTSTLPTTTNPNCPECDTAANPGSAIIGTFESAGYYHCGLYRPQFNCKMRKLGEPFCAVCERVIREHMAQYDPSFCATRPLDLSKWVAVATILFGVIQDGGGVIWVDGRPVPIDPWGPLRRSLWGALANPYDAPPAVRDALVATALMQLTSLLVPSASRRRVETAVKRLAEEAAANLPPETIR